MQFCAALRAVQECRCAGNVRYYDSAFAGLELRAIGGRVDVVDIHVRVPRCFSTNYRSSFMYKSYNKFISLSTPDFNFWSQPHYGVCVVACLGYVQLACSTAIEPTGFFAYRG